MTEFREKVGEILYKVSQNPSHFESDPDYMLETVSKELYDIAKKELEVNPEFIYTVTRKAAERARKETVAKVHKWLNENWDVAYTHPLVMDALHKEFDEFMEEQQ